MKLDFYTKRSQLDEMQEQKLCKLESRGFWLLWWGLLAAIIVQSLVGETAHPPIGEWVLFMLASLYMLVNASATAYGTGMSSLICVPIFLVRPLQGLPFLYGFI